MNLAVNNQPTERRVADDPRHFRPRSSCWRKRPAERPPFYVSPLFQPIASLISLLNPAAYDGGSHYLFVDGSVRFIKQSDYSNAFWLVDKNDTLLPFPPLAAATSRVCRASRFRLRVGLATVRF